jgi:hypothetical protein
MVQTGHSEKNPQTELRVCNWVVKCKPDGELRRKWGGQPIYLLIRSKYVIKRATGVGLVPQTSNVM